MNRQLHTQEDLHADRKYKDRLFRLVFSDKKDLLDLYNAVNTLGIFTAPILRSGRSISTAALPSGSLSRSISSSTMGPGRSQTGRS